MWPAGPQPISSTGPGGQAAAKRRKRSTSQGLRVSSSANSAAYCSATRSNAARTLSVLRCPRAAWRRGRGAGRWWTGRTGDPCADSRRARSHLDGQRAELALHRDAVRVARQPGHREDARGRPLGAEARQREGGHHVDVGGEGRARLGGRPLEDERLLGDRVEVDALLHDVRRAGQPAGALRVSIVTAVIVPTRRP